ncbi:MAG: winged helix-turn-helix transcriptional regulator [Opitutales bacterium]|nr:winged helix-turn-helix transcriptional regulator [Opitutales bacterium]
MKNLVTLFKALSDGNRLRILAALSLSEELCACQITELIKVTGATISRHLSLLQRADLVESRKDGRWVYYRIKATNAEMASIIQSALFPILKEDNSLKEDRERLNRITEIEAELLCQRQRGKECCH